ncbi:hypothetical protein B0A52_03146 [Exophiala mesophila]|uniref:Radical SAM core domain-containing protein n=1 Tax=Exophiala mesophila TaxID=212818 RepID=A0A438NAK3_EXOME|nr:hypothetical protein B0A52_03146 [Exophiala mesophila]
MLLNSLVEEGFAPNNIAVGILLGVGLARLCINRQVSGAEQAPTNDEHLQNTPKNPSKASTKSPSLTSQEDNLVGSSKINARIPLSVNYHFSRKCNYKCGFCFHTELTSHVVKLGEAKAALRLLAEAGMKKINFAGGEPFLYKNMLGEMVDFCKQELHLESVSIVSNGSNITRKWLETHARNLDILAVSCDSFDEETNVAIGRGTGQHIPKIFKVSEWCREFGIMFKLNTVVCKPNVLEDMNEQVARLAPYRWKCFQVLLVAGENDSATTKRDARKFQITDAEFDEFCRRHGTQKAMVPESNRVMAKSYLILDEYLRFLDRTGQKPSGSILDVGVDNALKSVFWDTQSFEERGGVYAWNEDMVEKEKEEKMGEETKGEARQNAVMAQWQAEVSSTGVVGGGGCVSGSVAIDSGTGAGSVRDMEDLGI